MSWLSRLVNALHPRRLDEDLAEELRDHLERRTGDLQARGASSDEARRRAAMSFGNATAYQEKSRDLRVSVALESSLQDVRYAWRGLRRNPAFAITAVLSLGLAIGANTAIYSIIDAALLRSLPVPQPERLFTFTAGGVDLLFSYPLYETLQSAAGRSAGLALFSTPNLVEARLEGHDAGYEEVLEQYVSPEALQVLGVSPVLGSLNSPDSAAATRASLVLSHEYWKRRFAEDPAILGRLITVDGKTYSVMGVAREGFSGPEPGKFIDMWLPAREMDPGIFSNPAIRLFHIMGRLAPNVERPQLVAGLQPAFLRLERSSPAGQLTAISGANGISAFRQDFLRPLWILLGVAAGILLIACANVASLLLARAAARSAEMAMRVSLGARRVRLVRQLLTESLLISLFALLLGAAISRTAAPALLSMLSTASNPVRLDLAPDTRMLLFCAAVCGGSALLFGLLPAWQATASDPMFALRRAGGQSTQWKAGRTFAAVQVAFAFCLVACGSGFLLSLHNLAEVNTGFDPRGVTVLNIVNTSQRDRQLLFSQQLQARTAALAGVDGAATSWTALLGSGRRAQRIAVPGQRPSSREETFSRISPGFFQTLGMPLLGGREFTFQDRETEPVPTIVNRAFAKRYFSLDAVLGRQFRRDDGVLHEIVGLVGDSRSVDLRTAPDAIAYMPMKPPRSFTLYVRSSFSPSSVMRLVQREAGTLGAEVRVRDVTTLEASVGHTVLKERLLATIGGLFAFLGLTLAAIGLFGLLNYTVARRTKDIGIRTALGARRWEIYRMLLADLLGIISAGLAAGFAGSVAVMNLAQSLLFGVRPLDPAVSAISIAIFLSAALLAGALPARRAAAIDPVGALRHQ